MDLECCVPVSVRAGYEFSDLSFFKANTEASGMIITTCQTLHLPVLVFVRISQDQVHTRLFSLHALIHERISQRNSRTRPNCTVLALYRPICDVLRNRSINHITYRTRSIPMADFRWCRGTRDECEQDCEGIVATRWTQSFHERDGDEGCVCYAGECVEYDDV